MTTIEWTRGDDGSEGKTWNPVAGCSLASAGCQNCYAMKFAHRFAGPGQRYEGLTELGKHGPRWTGEVRELPHRLAEPLKWKKPRRIFVNSMSDLFHADVSNEFIAAVFGMMAAAPRHTFQVLTKRAARMRDWFRWLDEMAQASAALFPADDHDWRRIHILRASAMRAGVEMPSYGEMIRCGWPLPNVWLGVSCEDQATADERIPLLLETPAAVRFISYEPALGPLQLHPGILGCVGHLAESFGNPLIHWVIVGGESGPGARPFDSAWAESIVEQCKAAQVAVFVKQLGAWAHDSVERLALKDRKGGDWNEWPEALRVREFPR